MGQYSPPETLIQWREQQDTETAIKTLYGRNKTFYSPHRRRYRMNVICDPRLSMAARILYNIIDMEAGDFGVWTDGWEKLAILQGTSKSSFFRSLKELETNGNILISHQGKKAIYTLDWFQELLKKTA